VAALVFCGIAPNLYYMVRDRGLSTIMSFSHVIFWVPLIVLLVKLVIADAVFSPAFEVYSVLLLVVCSISVFFDIGDCWKWIKGDRAVFGR